MSFRLGYESIPQLKVRKTLLAIMAAAALVGCDSDDKTNTPPVAQAGSNQSVNEGQRVILQGHVEDKDEQLGAIGIENWKQTKGDPVELVLGDNGEIFFVAPTLTKGETELVVFELSVTDSKGASASSEITITINNVEPHSIVDVQPGFGAVGTEVTIHTNIKADLVETVKLGTQSIVPTALTDERVTFIVPEGGTSAPLTISTTGGGTNAVWFTVSGSGLIAPDESKLIVDDSGTEYVSDYLIVAVSPEGDNYENAQRLAGLVSGEVIGQYPELSWWQIAVTAETLVDLEGKADTLNADTTVTNAIIDTLAKTDAVDWAQDPAIGEQRDRNHIEEGVQYYVDNVSIAGGDKALPFHMAIGVSESGVDFDLPDFSDYSGTSSNENTNIRLYSKFKSSESQLGEHGSNVVGLIAGELGDKGNAGLVASLAQQHSGASIRVDAGNVTVAGRLVSTLEMLRSGAQVINWSWGFHRSVATDVNGDGKITSDEVTSGARQCTGDFVLNNAMNQRNFDSYSRAIDNFFNVIARDYPKAVIVSSAGNGASDAGEVNNRLPSSHRSEQLIVVGAHTSGGVYADGKKEDDRAATDYTTSCFDTAIATDVKRAHYSNYGERVDIVASGTITGFENRSQPSVWGTSYAVPVVTSTVALMQSINPNLTPKEIKEALRSSALPIENKVLIEGGLSVVTRAITASESEVNTGKGARLNVKGALKAAITSLADDTLTKGPTVGVDIPEGASEVTKTIEVTIPGDKAVFDKVDVMFIVDVSGSYSDDIATFRTKSTEILDAFSSSGSNVTVGISSFSDFPVQPYGQSDDYEFKLDQALTNNFDAVKAAINKLNTLNGNDTPESQLEALYQTVQSASGWRSGALPAIFLATDANFHNSDTNAEYPGKGYTETLQALEQRKARVYGLQSGGSVEDVVEISEATKGEAFTLSRDSNEIVKAVVDAIDSASSDLAITLEPVGDFADVVKSIKPTTQPSLEDGAPITGVNPGDTISFDVTFTKGSLDPSKTHTIVFRLLVHADDVAVIQEVPVVLTVK